MNFLHVKLKNMKQLKKLRFFPIVKKFRVKKTIKQISKKRTTIKNQVLMNLLHAILTYMKQLRKLKILPQVKKYRVKKTIKHISKKRTQIKNQILMNLLHGILKEYETADEIEDFPSNTTTLSCNNTTNFKETGTKPNVYFYDSIMSKKYITVEEIEDSSSKTMILSDNNIKNSKDKIELKTEQMFNTKVEIDQKKQIRGKNIKNTQDNKRINTN
ncbi:hypothetical protein EDEG_03538 [Edhazardia aedis USNM 41457]|uniref:Uncharacterized protein n=1 Tax=Edhazardia aedis (strain USNM 41457) TaxID=1003232 RepID=J8ZQM2_EDHAE|nr:hypothetical protein EDEG_03538 [Edhazardia aedis USNM 41457]|eukprot:EJW02013.1 hypothetical protein EDEG_03538 [Edhazardia aedis USNM 41457]